MATHYLHCNLLIPSQTFKPAAILTNTARQAAFWVTLFQTAGAHNKFQLFGENNTCQAMEGRVRWMTSGIGCNQLYDRCDKASSTQPSAHLQPKDSAWPASEMKIDHRRNVEQLWGDIGDKGEGRTVFSANVLYFPTRQSNNSTLKTPAHGSNTAANASRHNMTWARWEITVGVSLVYLVGQRNQD